jgi:hypothetical protein
MGGMDRMDRMDGGELERDAERGEKSDSACKVLEDNADVVQSLD